MRMPAGADLPRWSSILRVGLLVVFATVMLWLVLSVDMPSIGELRGSLGEFRSSLSGLGWLALPAFALAYAAVALTPIPVTVMAVSAGLLFGTLLGGAVSVVGVLLGCWGAYWLARVIGKEAVRRLLGRRSDRIEDRLADHGFSAVFLFRVMPGMPYWPVNYGAGAFGVTQRDFVVGTMVAAVPGQLSLVAIGAFAAEPSLLNGIIVAAAWGVVLVMTVWSYRSLRGLSDRELPGASLAAAGDE